jgi:hypothetical protein
MDTKFRPYTTGDIDPNPKCMVECLLCGAMTPYKKIRVCSSCVKARIPYDPVLDIYVGRMKGDRG